MHKYKTNFTNFYIEQVIINRSSY